MTPTFKRGVEDLNLCGGIFAKTCETTVSLVCGFNNGELELNPDVLPNIFKGSAHSVSLKQFQHFLQLGKSGTFSLYDYEKLNKKIYNSTTPPAYPIQNIKCPTYIYSGSTDALVNEKDIKDLVKVLPNVKKYQNFKNFNLCDFNYGKNTRKLIFEDILASFNTECK